MLVQFSVKKKLCLVLILVLMMTLSAAALPGVACCNANVALDKPATCESFTDGHDASAANDRSAGSYWEAPASPAWWKVDLEAVYDLHEIRIVNDVNKASHQNGHGKDKGKGNNNQNYYQYAIYASPDDIHWYKIAEKTDTGKANGSGETHEVYALWVRYLRVDMLYNSANTAVQIKDFRVYGEPSSMDGLGIGEANLSEARMDFEVAEGVTRTLITRGYQSGTDVSKTTTGPWQVNVLTVDPDDYEGRVQARLCGGKVSTSATVLEEAVSQGATAAVNGSFFTVAPFNGTIGGSMGLFAVDGEVTNESINPRGAMLMPYGTADGIRIGRFTSTQTATASDGSSIPINGINRTPGVKVGVDSTYAPFHDNEAQLTNEVILYTDIFGKTTEKRLSGYSGSGWFKRPVYDDAGAEAIIGPDGVVTALYETISGHDIPEGGKVLAGIGTAADWIKTHACVGATINVDISLTCDGEPVELGPDASIISAGPCLIQDGLATTNDQWVAEGFKNATWNARNPRTLVGTKADGTLLIVVIDGRAPAISAGASLEECQIIMKDLGAVEVLNLDGGRSSVMTVGDQVVSNIIENRKVGDILELLP